MRNFALDELQVFDVIASLWIKTASPKQKQKTSPKKMQVTNVQKQLAMGIQKKRHKIRVFHNHLKQPKKNRRNPTSLRDNTYLSIFKGPIFQCNIRFLWWTPKMKGTKSPTPLFFFGRRLAAKLDFFCGMYFTDPLGRYWEDGNQ